MKNFEFYLDEFNDTLDLRDGTETGDYVYLKIRGSVLYKSGRYIPIVTYGEFRIHKVSSGSFIVSTSGSYINITNESGTTWSESLSQNAQIIGAGDYCAFTFGSTTSPIGFDIDKPLTFNIRLNSQNTAPLGNSFTVKVKQRLKMFIDGHQVDKVYLNGTELSNVYFNGTKIDVST